jgi:hypothetical protein
VLPLPPFSDPDTAVITLATHARTDVPAACDGLRAVIGAHDADVVVCDVSGIDADLMTVEVLARLRLTAQRLGCRLELRNASPALQQLIGFCGLCDVLPRERLARLDRRLALGRDGGQPEEGEQPLGVEERVEARDPPV